MEPTKLGRKKLMDYFRSSTPKKVMVAFVFNKDPQESEWLYGHELGRLYLDEHYPDTIKTLKVHNIASEEEAISAMEDLIAMGVSIIFNDTTAHQCEREGGGQSSGSHDYELLTEHVS